MNQFGNILYNTDEPNIYILTQIEVSTAYDTIFTELRSEGRTNNTEILLCLFLVENSGYYNQNANFQRG